MKKRTVEDCPSCSSATRGAENGERPSLSHWPIQIKLVGTVAPFLRDADLLVAADCTAFAAREFHDTYLPGKKVLIGCPKLDDATFYVDKFTEIFSTIPITSVRCLRMEVPCCGGMTMVLKEAIRRSEKEIPLTETIIGIKGELRSDRPLDIEAPSETVRCG